MELLLAASFYIGRSCAVRGLAILLLKVVLLLLKGVAILFAFGFFVRRCSIYIYLGSLAAIAKLWSCVGYLGSCR